MRNRTDDMKAWAGNVKKLELFTKMVVHTGQLANYAI